ncbi:ubiquitin-like 1-activating enzyme E1 A [Fusarium pseudocircinatum]|uniref:Ubiquitin-like 1-activating enzyme E1A n=1 Tax=Fusarium pseudocircinatum TaxID=56676 RepID=A0A8H5KYF7_9HYPO|nr:ubiquitin-like 1-activating enzyme E1 A [Fusarium pseudocircinatum]
MDNSNQDQGQPHAEPQAQQLPNASAQEAIPHIDASASINVNGNGIPQLQENLLNPMNPQALSMLADPSLMADPSMMAMQMPLADPSFMMQPGMSLPNGQSGFSLPVAPPTTVSADEVALYDRQIRLWGMAAQAKIQSANILLITIKALANEIAKNLVLAGVGSLTLLDSATVTEADRGAQFFIPDGEDIIGQNRAQVASAALQKLNPRVRVHVDTEGVKTKGPSYFAAYDIVIATDLDPESFNIINTATRLNCKAFYAAGCHGLYGFIFSDLIEHDYVIQRDLGNMPTSLGPESRTRTIVDVQTRKEGPKTIESVTKRELYSTWFLASDLAVLPTEYTQSKRRLKSVTPALSCLRALWEFMQIQNGRVPSNRDDLKLFTQIATQKHKALGLPSETLRPEFLRSFLQNLVSEISPVAAILGGQLAQDVINVLGQTQQPIQNMIVFDGTTMEALMYPLHPEGSLGASQLTDHTVPNGGAPMILGGMDALPLGLDPTTMATLPHHNNPIMISTGLPQNGNLIPMPDGSLADPTQPFNAAGQVPQQPVQGHTAQVTAEQTTQETPANPGASESKD